MFEILFYLLFRLTLETRDVRPDVRPGVRPDVDPAGHPGGARVVRGGKKKTRGVRGAAAPRLNPSRGGVWGGEAPLSQNSGGPGAAPPSQNRKFFEKFSKNFEKKKLRTKSKVISIGKHYYWSYCSSWPLGALVDPLWAAWGCSSWQLSI